MLLITPTHEIPWTVLIPMLLALAGSFFIATYKLRNMKIETLVPATWQNEPLTFWDLEQLRDRFKSTADYATSLHREISEGNRPISLHMQLSNAKKIPLLAFGF